MAFHAFPGRAENVFPGGGGPTTPGAIVHAIRGENVDFPTFADGIRAQRVVAAVLDSMKSSAWQGID